MSLTVLHVSSAITWRGGEQQIAYLLAGLTARNVKNIVLCPENSVLFAKCKQEGIQVFGYHKRNLDPRIARTIKSLCNQLKVDIIHLHDSHSHTYGALAATLFGSRIPMILSRRVDFPIQKSPLSRWKYNHPRIKKILCVSHCILEIMRPDISAPDRLQVVYSGVDPQRIAPASGILRTEFPSIGERAIVANVASIAPHKDYFTFVDTVASFIKQYGSQLAKFMIIGGDGGELNTIQAYIRSKGLTNQIILTGFRDDISGIMGELDILLVSSKTEGLCTTIIDAFNAQVPVVATKAGGIPELITNGETGLLAEIKDFDQLKLHCYRLLTDPPTRKHIIKRATEKAQSFTADQMAANTLAHYSSSLG